MPCISLPVAMGASAIIGGGASILGSSMQAGAAQSAAQVQYNADMQALQMQYKMFNQIQSNLSPYMKYGQAGMNQIMGLMGEGTPGGALGSYFGKPLPNPMTAAGPVPNFSWNPTMQGLAQTPGYQFALQQGELAVQNQNASMGLGQSGAQTKAAENYAEGLASTTYNQQLENAMSVYNTQLGGQQQRFGQALNTNQQNLFQRNQLFNQLSNQVGTGLNAATGLGQFGQNTANLGGQFLTSGGAAQAGGIMGAANAWAGGIGALGQSFGQGLTGMSMAPFYMNMMNQQYGQSGGLFGQDEASQLYNNMNFDGFFGSGG